MRYTRDVLTWFLGLILVFPILKTEAGSSVPVLIWGGDLANSKPNHVNPFERTSQGDFEKIVTNIVGGALHPVLVFYMDEFCIENITHDQTLNQFMDGRSVIYQPLVDTPLSVFENLPSYNSTTDEKLESLSDGQLVLKKITNLNVIPGIFNMTKESYPKLVAALTGTSCQYRRSERIKRAADDEPTPSPRSTAYVINETRILFYAGKAPTLKVSDDKEITVELTKNGTQEGNGTNASPLQLNFEYTVKNGSETYKANVLLRFPVKIAGYYSPEVLYKRDNLNTTLASSGDRSFPYNFSYHCSQNVRFGNATFIRFDMTDFQVQIDGKNFGDAYDCVGFTSIPIWAGIFVTSILAIIMIWGLTMVMDIRTMDRFDDPKGKTITISATAE